MKAATKVNFEIRISKSETNPNIEFPNGSLHRTDLFLRVVICKLVIRICFGFRDSSFGFVNPFGLPLSMIRRYHVGSRAAGMDSRHVRFRGNSHSSTAASGTALW